MVTNLRQALNDMTDGQGGLHPEVVEHRVDGLVRRVRRRRAARRAGTGLVATGAAAAVAVVGVPRVGEWLSGPSAVPGPAGPVTPTEPTPTDPVPTDPAPTDPAPTGTGADWQPAGDLGQELGVCRSVLDLPDGSVHEVLSMSAVTRGSEFAPGATVEVEATVTNDTGMVLRGTTSSGTHVLITRGGVVVGSMGVMTEELREYALAPGESMTSVGTGELVGCEGIEELEHAGQPLPEGEYQVYAMQTFTSGEAATEPAEQQTTVVAVVGTIRVADDAPTQPADAADGVRENLVACGAAWGPETGGLLWVDAGFAEGTDVTGRFELTARLGTDRDERVIANVPTWADLVVVRGGTVVGLGRTGEADVQLAELGAGDVLDLTSTYELAACAADGTLTGPLPSGDYEVRITLPVSLKEVGDESVSTTVRVTSDAIPLTIP
jgi:hypothetical protein